MLVHTPGTAQDAAVTTQPAAPPPPPPPPSPEPDEGTRNRGEALQEHPSGAAPGSRVTVLGMLAHPDAPNPRGPVPPPPPPEPDEWVTKQRGEAAATAADRPPPPPEPDERTIVRGEAVSSPPRRA